MLKTIWADEDKFLIGVDGSVNRAIKGLEVDRKDVIDILKNNNAVVEFTDYGKLCKSESDAEMRWINGCMYIEAFATFDSEGEAEEAVKALQEAAL